MSTNRYNILYLQRPGETHSFALQDVYQLLYHSMTTPGISARSKMD